jgi:hypothetical protein
MNRKFYFSLLAFTLTLVATVAFVIGHGTRTRAASPNAAASALPPSDFVISIDVQRALSEMLPGVLSGNPALLAKFNAHIEEFEKKTGINPRVFESVAIGGNLNPMALAGQHNPSGVVIARGHFESDKLLSAAFEAASKQCQFEKEEQQYEGKTIFLISTVKPLKDAAKDSAPTIQGQHSVLVSASLPSNDKFAVVALDPSTIAVGSLESVRATIDASLKHNYVDAELVQMATQTPNAVVGFSGKIPQSASEKSSAQNAGNPFAKYLTSVRGFYGSFGISGNEAETIIALRTETAEQAHDIGQAINSLKVLASFGISQAAGTGSPQHDAMAAALKGLSVTAQDNEVRIDARIPQAIIAPFMRIH